jgi:hypothetical protein
MLPLDIIHFLDPILIYPGLLFSIGFPFMRSLYLNRLLYAMAHCFGAIKSTLKMKDGSEGIRGTTK